MGTAVGVRDSQTDCIRHAHNTAEEADAALTALVVYLDECPLTGGDAAMEKLEEALKQDPEDD